jgi:branched-chain amino acid transport system substrate-binding protein
MWAWFILLTVCQFLSNCSETAEEPQWKGPARIAVVVPSNGPLKDEGEMLRLGTIMAMEEAGGRVADHQVEMTLYGSPCKASSATALAERIAADTSISGVIGYLCAETIRVVLPIYREAHLALINPTVSADYIRRDKSRHLFPLLYGDGEQGEFLAAYAKMGLGLSRVAILSDGSAYGDLLKTYFLGEASRLGLELVENISVNPTADEAARAVGVIKDRAPEATLLAALPRTASVFLVEHRRQHVGGVVLGSDQLADLDFYETAGEAADGLLVCQPILLDREDAEKSEFVRKFKQFSKRSPDWIAVAGYDAMRLALEVLNRSGPERASFLEVIREISGPDRAFTGLGGPVFFKQDGTSQRPFFMAEIHSGRLRPARPPTVKFPVTLGSEK